jgi:hypothetical protein
MTVAPEDDWTPVARSSREAVATIVLPDESFELEDLRELARSLGEVGFPVLVAESASQRRSIVAAAAIPVVIHVAPIVKDLLVGVTATATWDAIKSAFGRLRRRGDQAGASELIIDLQVQSDHLVASARGPAAEAVAEVARILAERGRQAGD